MMEDALAAVSGRGAGTERGSRVDGSAFREVMGHYPTGVVVVTGIVDDEPVGMVVGTFTSVSLDPPLVAFLPTKESSTYERLRRATSYCINVLAYDQLDLCRAMASRRPDKFAQVRWAPSEFGAPMLDGAVAHIHCSPTQVIEAGDHWIVMCAVRDMAVARPVTPLLFFQGGYGGFSARVLSARGDAELIDALQLAESAKPEVTRLAEALGCEAGVQVPVGADHLIAAVASYGGPSSMSEHLGLRLPLMPPIGEALVAGASPEVVDAWLRRAIPQEPNVVDMYRERLERVVERGVSVSVFGPGGRQRYETLSDALVEHAAGVHTPAAERALQRVIAELSEYYEPIDFVDDELYDVGMIVAPVRNAEGEPVMALRLRQLPQRQPGSTVTVWIEELRTAAEEVARQLSVAERSG